MQIDQDSGLFNIFGADGLEVSSFTGDRYLLIAEKQLDDELSLPLNISINQIASDGSLVEKKRIFLSREIYAEHGENGIDGTNDIRSRLAEAIQLISSPATFLEGLEKIERLQDIGFIIGNKEHVAEIRGELSDGQIIKVELLPEVDVNEISFFTERK